MSGSKQYRERCDRCKKFTSSRYSELYTLEGIVSPGLEVSWAICQRYFDLHPATEREYWDKWVTKRSVQ
ncbi:hypothetical protein VF04_04405 [Nostoc linckia z7]|uniref:Uncharacterized protein n=2 Tax=Nostoc linckia TaxID=92942 RepID=A0A9Q5ZGI2_NOSLI|nr:hypothetical protein [Nostoc linckia]PHK42953.1 hypothetical protein VF12_01105 [Nostoc linckia z15]PHK48110.1 hypothetical protein VF13_02080 [Nostoc linckia z16]PHJ65030.1 hypothetical protein VF02_11890 [Nostoc linckia z1]PHJ70071.1 hypothetical protein VF05_11285 [Nostoc linckia z3]PHJ75109.1 hypothetical protein VF03_12210 [Nostoc linckia z2]